MASVLAESNLDVGAGDPLMTDFSTRTITTFHINFFEADQLRNGYVLLKR